MNDETAFALHQRIEKVEQVCRWLVDYCSTIESALIAALPPCTLGENGPSLTPAHVAVCRRCAALSELDLLPDSPLPDDGDEENEGDEDASD